MPSPNAPAIPPHTNSLHTKKSVMSGEGSRGFELRPPTPAVAAAAAPRAGGEDGDASMVADACDFSKGLGF